MTEQFDAIVIGAGHAGCEAALALARLSCKTALFTVSVDSIAMMPCNPNVGGTSKGHLVREIDALGGEMGKNIDRTFIQSKMLNQSKGPAVHSLRAQADKKEYSYAMRKVIEETDGVSIKQGEITDIIVEDGKVYGVKSYTGAIYPCKVVVLCTGTYLNARCITGETSVYTGPNGLQSATHLTDSLKKLGISMRRFKTGTPARMDGRTIDYSKMEPQYGDEKIVPFSFENKPEDLEREQVKCWLTYTNEETHKVIRENLDRSPLYSGYIKGTGPRYCPSIEDKVVRFADKNRHQVFIEPEGNYTNEMYVGGMSSSLPEDVQEKMYRSVPGLEHAKIVRNAYAIEYDCLDSLELLPTLELKKVKGLFSAGQANGSSGYEEAAAQGILAGLNAALYARGDEGWTPRRDEAYLGVMVDDLTTKGVTEPYRMFTSRAEYRLSLREDNADARLTPTGRRLGLVDDLRWEYFNRKTERVQRALEMLKDTWVNPKIIAAAEAERVLGTSIEREYPLRSLLARPNVRMSDLATLRRTDGTLAADFSELNEVEKAQVEVEVKYAGYVERQKDEIEKALANETLAIPDAMDYDAVTGLSFEVRQKLKAARPETLGQASRVSGVTPAAVALLLVHLKRRYYYQRDKGSVPGDRPAAGK